VNFVITNRPPKRDTTTIEVGVAPGRPTPHTAGPTLGDVTLLSPASGKAKQGARLLVSLGPAGELTVETVRRAGGSAARWLIARRMKEASVDLTALPKGLPEGSAVALCEGIKLASFTFEDHKSPKEGNAVPPRCTVRLHLGSGNKPQHAATQRALTVCDAVHLARSWAHEPPNVINPETLVQRLKPFAAEHGLRLTVLDDKKLGEMGAGAIRAVGLGSQTGARLIVLEYPGSSKNGAQPVVLVGKAITFDTGGYSIKDKTSIVGMKYDKCGGMAVIGAMKAVADLKLKNPVVGVIAAAENMISAQAYRPNDIIRAMNGKTIEIISTDAEGRMVLADALTYACRNLKPAALIDLATLTGGIVIALGAVRAGVMGNNDDLITALSRSGEAVAERLWRMPLDDEYFELIKGDDSDMKNSAAREAHPIVGGIFLKQFVDAGVPWAHLDIAGVADAAKDLPYCPRGATGFGVRLLVHYLQQLEPQS
jgi:leucyl aminopeptidase